MGSHGERRGVWRLDTEGRLSDLFLLCTQVPGVRRVRRAGRGAGRTVHGAQTWAGMGFVSECGPVAGPPCQVPEPSESASPQVGDSHHLCLAQSVAPGGLGA